MLPDEGANGSVFEFALHASCRDVAIRPAPATRGSQ